ncbi:uracil-DNA glycosylase [Cupriavidus oxalaticus]|uniref:Uracil-DNA glycosylase n=1 Tax=Cupriavidus oxalaticus TaxID=96344 RepID=A0A5P3VH07_9BURK|nr:uracil-DNA glycosylase [Cupriavidus oxalaticus]
MTPRSFVAALAEIRLESVFNPYSNRCEIHDLADAPAVRRRNLRTYLTAIEELGADTIWMGRDLGYRGGRRTGLALTDERRLDAFAHSYPGATPNKATKGPVVAERTAAEIWAILERLDRRPLLWNVFPFHPHEADAPMTNRKFSAKELAAVSELNHTLFKWLGIRRIICIGQDAASYARSFGISVECVRHPSYGGVADFRRGMQEIYGDSLAAPASDASQPTLF